VFSSDGTRASSVFVLLALVGDADGRAVHPPIEALHVNKGRPLGVGYRAGLLLVTDADGSAELSLRDGEKRGHTVHASILGRADASIRLLKKHYPK
jgi:hypothetical protein